MTIDEAIEQLKEAKCGNCPTLFCEECVKGNKRNQIAEWLEELKELIKFKNDFTDLGKLYSEIRLEERNKAIDDFMNMSLEIIKSEQDTRYGYLDGMDIREIARVLKAGGKND